MSAGNNEGLCVGAVGVIKDFMRNPKSESWYLVFSAWRSIYFLFGSASHISVIQAAIIDLDLWGILESVRDFKAVPALRVGCA